jgi:uncharacterized protein YbcI
MASDSDGRRTAAVPVLDYGRRAAAVSNAITRLHREYYGRGATTTHTVIQRNYVIAFLSDIYTPVERTLIDDGHHETVKTTRQAFQMTMSDRFGAAVEEIMGRKVIAFMSQVHFDPDMAAEVFVLAPEEGDQGPDE